MASFEQTEVLDAPIFRVIQAIEYVLRDHTMTIDRTRGIGLLWWQDVIQVYRWQIDEGGSTYLTHAVVPYSKEALTTLQNAPDVIAAARELPREIAEADCDAARHRLIRIRATTAAPELLGDAPDEVVEIGNYPPYHPATILLVSSVFGLAGGILAGLNWQRLGLRWKVVRTSIVTLFYGVIVVGLLSSSERSRLLPLVLLLNIGVGLWLARSQWAAYRRWRGEDTALSLLASGLSTVVLLVGIGALFWVFAVRLSSSASSPESVTSATTHTPLPTQTPVPLQVAFDFPDTWTQETPEAPELGCIDTANQRCLLVAVRADGAAQLAAYERRWLLSLPLFASMIDNEVLKLNPHYMALMLSSVEDELDGYPAILQTRYWCDNTCTHYFLSVIAINSDQHIVVVITTNWVFSDNFRSELNSLIESIRITN